MYLAYFTMSNIYILSRAIQSGKTTELMHWSKQQNSIAGVLTPDINKVRKLYNIASQSYFDFAVNNSLEHTISIGKFHFLLTAFNKAQQILLDTLQCSSKWLVVDEIGPLELNQNKGLAPVIDKVINHYKEQQQKNNNLLIVVRNNLLAECIEKYQLKEAIVISSMSEINKPKLLMGIVLAGGKSSRMHTDKAFITYHTQPQLYHLYYQLKLFCNEVCISCNTNQKLLINKAYQYISDIATQDDCGPIVAIISVMEKYRDLSYMLIACDYPFLTINNIQQLKEAWQVSNRTVCFYNNETGFIEPLLAIYDAKDLPALKQFYKNGNYSLSQFLIQINAAKITPTIVKDITSVDTKEDYKNAMAYFKK